MSSRKISTVSFIISVLLLGLGDLYSLARIRVSSIYEDTVRIGIIWNDALGDSFSPASTKPVGEQTRDFVLESIGYNDPDSGASPSNIRIGMSDNTTWADVRAWWGGGVMPHVIVHVQAGWYTFNGPYIQEILDSAADLAIGVVSVGDDAAWFAENVFGITAVDNSPDPMDWGGSSISPLITYEPLWIELDRDSDTLDAPGIVRSAVDSILAGNEVLEFKPFEEGGRGTADADEYSVMPSFPVAFYGYQRGWDGSDTISGPTELPVIAVYQDSVRRGVALSYEPQYLINREASEQIVYDAIIYGSFAHLVFQKVATPEVITIPTGQTSFDASLVFTISTTTPNATIYYTLDGSPPTESSTVFDGTPITITNTTTVRAFATALGYLDSDTMLTVLPRNSTPSAIEILNAAGNPFPGNIITSDQTAYTIRLSTNYYEGSDQQVFAVTTALGDNETIILDTNDITGSGGSYARIYEQGSNPFAVTSSNTDGNNTLEAYYYNTIVVTWTNPLDPGDVARDTVYVEPADVTATVHFSLSSGGTAVADYPEGQTPAYVVVTDQFLNDGLTYNVVLTTLTGESETLGLTKVSDTLMTAQLPASYLAVVQNDSTLQVNLGGEQIQATYTDPEYPLDVAMATVNYAAKTIDPPTISPPTGTYFVTDTTIVLTPDSSSHSIRYTLDNSAPSDVLGTLYGGSFTISASGITVVKAISYLKHDDNNFVLSAPIEALYTRREQVGQPWAVPAATYFTEDTTVSLFTAAPSDDIYYTTDGVTTPDSAVSALYGSALTINSTTTLMFYAVNGPNIPSTVETEVYTKRDTLARPTATPAGTNYSGTLSVTLNHAVPGARIYYTTDGSDPDLNSTQYGGALNISLPTTIKAIAYGPDGSDAYVQSLIMTEDYNPILTVTATPTARSFTSSVQVSLSTNSPTATIYYTVNDGDDPNTSDTQYSTPLTFNVTSTLKAIAVDSGWVTSSVLDETYTRSATASRIEILDENGIAFTDDIITGDVTRYSVKLYTHQDGAAPYQPSVITFNGDADTLTLTTLSSPDTFSLAYLDTFDFAINTANPLDDILQAKAYDTVIATWINPLTAGDTARDTVYVQPADVSANLYFSTSSTGADTVSSFNENQTPIYVVVEDQVTHDDSTYSVTITANSSESETFALSPVSGKLIATIPVEYAAIASDNTLQALLGGDRFTASYNDPLYPADSVSGFADYAAKSVAAPEYIPISGVFFKDDTTISITSDSTTASIRYTTDGTDPSQTAGTLVGGGIPISASTVFNAVAYFSFSPTNYVLSSIVQASFNLRGYIGTPYADPRTTYFTEDTTVTLHTVPPASGDVIYYALGGAVPNTSSSVYGTPLVFNSTDTLRFFADQPPDNPSITVTEVYTKRDTLASPTATPTGTNYTGTLAIALNHVVPGARIFYTTDGTTPNHNSARYSDTIRISRPTTITAIAYGPVGSDAYVKSSPMVQAYNPTLTVTATPGGQNFTSIIQVSLSSNSPTATIYFTENDGDDPNTSDTPYATPLSLNITTVLKAIATDSGWVTSSVLTQTYTRNTTASEIEILDENGVAFPDDIITGDVTRYSVKLSTHQDGATSYEPVAVTFNGDADTLDMVTPAPRDTFFMAYRDVFDFAVGTANPLDDILQAKAYDTVIATWINPLTTGDTARDTVYVQPANVAASLYFSTSATGADTVTGFSEAHTPIYVVVVDQVTHDDSTYRISLTTNSTETETFDLSPVSGKL
ncbi:chitobiase/beta-hexosaminidase C-terminal domain-containing protein, partial [Fibrobacterota bacterium]